MRTDDCTKYFRPCRELRNFSNFDPFRLFVLQFAFEVIEKNTVAPIVVSFAAVEIRKLSTLDICRRGDAGRWLRGDMRWIRNAALRNIIADGGSLPKNRVEKKSSELWYDGISDVRLDYRDAWCSAITAAKAHCIIALSLLPLEQHLDKCRRTMSLSCLFSSVNWMERMRRVILKYLGYRRLTDDGLFIKQTKNVGKVKVDVEAIQRRTFEQRDTSSFLCSMKRRTLFANKIFFILFWHINW